jgi:hypothetical protein
MHMPIIIANALLMKGSKNETQLKGSETEICQNDTNQAPEKSVKD